LDRLACHARGQRGGRSRHAVSVSAEDVVVEFEHAGAAKRA
jgi:hypothetical protein